jgi:septum formation protein
MPSSPPPLLLASTSRYRRELLERLALPFETQDPGVIEKVREGELPDARASRLALEKARAVAERHAGAWVIGSDQVASLGPLLLEKPGNAHRCAAQLRALSGREATFHTAVALVRGHTIHRHLDTTRVDFRELSGEEIERYIEREQPFDCAGGFKSEGLGVSLFARLATDDPTALIGLPLIWLSGALRRAGYLLP